jgi:HSP20 family protein
MLQKGEREPILKKDERQPAERQSAGRLQETGEGRRYLTPMAQMDRLFDEMFKRPFFSLWSPRMGGEMEMEQLNPPVDIYDDGESVVVKAEIPGIRKEDLNIDLTPDRITISGEKSAEQRVQQKDFHRLERSYGSFSRSCQLPAETLPDKARAVFKDGVLEVRIPKVEGSQQRVRKLKVE